MHLEHPTLDGLSRAELEREIDRAPTVVRASGAQESEALPPSGPPWLSCFRAHPL